MLAPPPVGVPAASALGFFNQCALSRTPEGHGQSGSKRGKGAHLVLRDREERSLIYKRTFWLAGTSDMSRIIINNKSALSPVYQPRWCTT